MAKEAMGQVVLGFMWTRSHMQPSGQGWGADPRGDTRVSRNSHPQPCHLADLAKQIIFFQKMAPGGGGEALPAAPGAMSVPRLTSPLSDPQEALEACQTRISKMELQQQQQQVVQLEGLENATARNLLGKLINILLAVMAVLLVFVSTVANCVVPLMKTRSRTFSTLLLVVFIAFLWKHWDALLGYVQRFFSSPR